MGSQRVWHEWATELNWTTAWRIFSCRIWDLAPWAEIEPGPVHWEHGVLAIGPPGKFSFFLYVWKVYIWVTQSCPTLGDPMDHSMPGYSVHWLSQATILEWIAIPFSQGYSQSRDWTCVPCIAGRFFTIWITRKTLFLCLILPSY